MGSRAALPPLDRYRLAFGRTTPPPGLGAGDSLGPYRILERIGRGGMAAVFKAYQPALSRSVAIKVLPAHLAAEPGFKERFQQEAVAVAALRHDSIPAIYDYAQDGEVAYIVTEFIEGGALERRLASPLLLDAVDACLSPIASALDYAHAPGIVDVTAGLDPAPTADVGIVGEGPGPFPNIGNGVAVNPDGSLHFRGVFDRRASLKPGPAFVQVGNRPSTPGAPYLNCQVSAPVTVRSS